MNTTQPDSPPTNSRDWVICITYRSERPTVTKRLKMSYGFLISWYHEVIAILLQASQYGKHLKGLAWPSAILNTF
jgi:hypothetical protein